MIILKLDHTTNPNQVCMLQYKQGNAISYISIHAIYKHEYYINVIVELHSHIIAIDIEPCVMFQPLWELDAGPGHRAANN